MLKYYIKNSIRSMRQYRVSISTELFKFSSILVNIYRLKSGGGGGVPFVIWCLFLLLLHLIRLCVIGTIELCALCYMTMKLVKKKDSF